MVGSESRAAQRTHRKGKRECTEGEKNKKKKKLSLVRKPQFRNVAKLKWKELLGGRVQRRHGWPVGCFMGITNWMS